MIRTDDLPDDWRIPDDPITSPIVSFEPGRFGPGAGNTTLPDPGEPVEQELANEIHQADPDHLLERSSRAVCQYEYVEDGVEIRVRRTVWRDADEGVIYARMESHDPDGETETASYNDGTRYVYGRHDGDDETYYHVLDPSHHVDRSHTRLAIGALWFVSHTAHERLTIGDADLVRASGNEVRPEVIDQYGPIDIDAARMYLDDTPAIRYSRGVASGEDIEFDVTLEIRDGSVSIDEPPWLERALEEERDAVIPP